MRIVNEPKKIHGLRVVQDYKEIAEALQNGESVYHWEAGDSMRPLIRHMEYCKIVPCVPIDVKRGDAVFCKLKDQHTGEEYYMVHQVWEISNCGYDHRMWFKIGSTGTNIFGWSCDILGKAYGTDIFQEATPEIRAAWEEEWRKDREMREAGEP
jgi:hypothetical protein